MWLGVGIGYLSALIGASTLQPDVPNDNHDNHSNEDGAHWLTASWVGMLHCVGRLSPRPLSGTYNSPAVWDSNLLHTCYWHAALDRNVRLHHMQVDLTLQGGDSWLILQMWFTRVCSDCIQCKKLTL